MRVLITGGFGYLGGRFAQAIMSGCGYEVVLGSRRHVEPPSWLPNAEVKQLQWNSLVALEKTCDGADVVVHVAGMNAHDCTVDPVAALEVNAIATARLLRAAVQQKVKRFIYISTAHVYGNPLIGVITEKTCPSNLHPYATSHRAGEDVVRSFHQSGSIEGIVVRLSNAFGVPAYKDVNCWTLLVNDLCRQAVNDQRLLLRSSGTQRRDFITLTDTCRAIEHLLELPQNRLGDGLYNVGGGWSPTILEMTQRVARRIQYLTGRCVDVLLGEDKEDNGSALIEYRIDKLINTGFALIGRRVVDQEVDALIQFCLDNRT